MSEQTTVRIVMEVIVGERVKRVTVDVQGQTPIGAEVAATSAIAKAWKATSEATAT